MNFRKRLKFSDWKEAVERLLKYHELLPLLETEETDYYRAGYTPDMVSREIRERIGMQMKREG